MAMLAVASTSRFSLRTDKSVSGAVSGATVELPSVETFNRAVDVPLSSSNSDGINDWNEKTKVDWLAIKSDLQIGELNRFDSRRNVLNAVELLYVILCQK